MLKIAIFGSTIQKKYYSTIEEIILKLSKADFKIIIYEDFAKILNSKNNVVNNIPTFCEINPDITDIILSFGGDGTFLKCAHLVYKYNIPILGINFGKLGFLADVIPSKIDEIIKNLKNGNYSICTRSILDFSIFENGEKIEGIGLNEITLQKSNHLKLIKINIYINDDYFCSFWADGVIISTPTGSTGYSLSLGGPIITPDSKALLVTPIAPHTLNIRPIIIPDNSIIKLEAVGDFTNFLISNDFNSTLINHPPQVIIKKSIYEIKTIQLHNITFFDVLRKKLQLGIDIRK